MFQKANSMPFLGGAFKSTAKFKRLLKLGVASLLTLGLIGHAQAQADAQRQPHVVVVATGGTIAQTTSTKSVLLVDKLLDAVPNISKLAKVSAEQMFQVSSPDISISNWLALAKRINVLLKDPAVDGIVVTHGTDTMEETAYFLNLVVNSQKPVVLVGSMRSSTALSADGPANLYNAIGIAASRDSIGKGVMVTLNDKIADARDVTKTNTVSLDTFHSPNSGFIGYVQDGRPYFNHSVTKKNTVNSEFDITNLTSLPQVEIVYSYVSVLPHIVDDAVKAGAKGIVYAGTGNGSIPEAIQPAVIAAVKAGVSVVRSSRTGSGVVVRNGEHDDDKLGLVAADTLNPQKSRILLMLALTKTNDPKEIQRIFYSY